MKKLQSLARYLGIQLQRQYFQFKREFTGKPDLRYTMITPQLYVGGAYKLRGLDTLKKWRITAVVNMRTHTFQQASHADWLDYLHLPTPDRTPPSIEKLEAGAAFIQRHITAGGKVYVHCRWGEGRGPSMAVAYLISTGMTTDDALTLIRQARPFISIEKSQIKRLRLFERSYIRNKLI